jgi:hypothetical protein
MTREQMVAEFGEPGVQNPMIVDLVALDPNTGRVVLAMLEPRPWNAGPRQFRQIEEKINRYLGYILDGHLARQYPEYAGKRVQIRLQCAEAPAGEPARFVAAAEHAIRAEGIDFELVVAPPSV